MYNESWYLRVCCGASLIQNIRIELFYVNAYIITKGFIFSCT